MCLFRIFPKYKNDAKVSKKVKIFNTNFQDLNPYICNSKQC